MNPTDCAHEMLKLLAVVDDVPFYGCIKCGVVLELQLFRQITADYVSSLLACVDPQTAGQIFRQHISPDVLAAYLGEDGLMALAGEIGQIDQVDEVDEVDDRRVGQQVDAGMSVPAATVNRVVHGR